MKQEGSRECESVIILSMLFSPISGYRHFLADAEQNKKYFQSELADTLPMS